MAREQHTFRSSRVTKAFYDTKKFELLVIFPDGNRFRYLNVPEWIWRDFIAARSAGRFLNTVLSPNYSGY